MADPLSFLPDMQLSVCGATVEVITTEDKYKTLMIYIHLGVGEIARTIELQPGWNLDLNREGNPRGLEIVQSMLQGEDQKS